ncbi:hypothetical protein ACO1O0_005040 [Amphichorda felina]
MKFFALTVASLAAVAAASPSPKATKKCKPGTYSCTNNAEGWQTCDVSGKWVFSGECPPDTVCKFFPPSHSPYCVPADFEIS